MKRNDELKTTAETIRDETSAGANTAERVGGHLADMVKRLNHTGIRQADADVPERAFVPTFSFKYDDYAPAWLTSPDVFASVYGAAVPLTYFIITERIWQGVMLEGATLTFVAGANRAGYIQNDVENFDTDVFQPGMIITVDGTVSNDHTDMNNPKFFLIHSVDGNKLYIDNIGTNRIGVSNESSIEGIDIHRGIYTDSPGVATISYSDLATLINTKSVEIGSHTRTERWTTASRSHLPISDAEMWEEAYGSKRDLEDGIRAAAALLETPGRAATYEVTSFVPPFGANTDRSVQIARQAGYKAIDGYLDGAATPIGRLVNTSIIHSGRVQEINTAPPVRVANAKTSTISGASGQKVLTITGGTGSFEGLIQGDPIVMYDSTGWQFRIVDVAPVVGDDYTTITVDRNLNVTMTDGAWYDPRIEDVDISYGDAETDQSTIGYINEILREGKGWLNIAGHGGYTSQSSLETCHHGVCLLYLKYIKNLTGAALPIFKGMLGLSDDYGIKMHLWDSGTTFAYMDIAVYDNKIWQCSTGSSTGDIPGVANWTDVSASYPLMLTEPVHIAIKSFYDAYNDYAPLLEAGLGFSASEDGVRIDAADGASFQMNDTNTLLGKNSAIEQYGEYVTAVGKDSAENNAGDNVVAIGDRAAEDNEYNNVFIIRSKGAAGTYTTPALWGFMNGRTIQGAPAITADPATLDGYLGNSRMSFYLTEGATPKLMVRVKGATGTLYTGEISLAADE